jgi:hypothetical protein
VIPPDPNNKGEEGGVGGEVKPGRGGTEGKEKRMGRRGGKGRGQGTGEVRNMRHGEIKKGDQIDASV